MNENSNFVAVCYHLMHPAGPSLMNRIPEERLKKKLFSSIWYEHIDTHNDDVVGVRKLLRDVTFKEIQDEEIEERNIAQRMYLWFSYSSSY